jgi:hypothetical protein
MSLIWFNQIALIVPDEFYLTLQELVDWNRPV